MRGNFLDDISHSLKEADLYLSTVLNPCHRRIKKQNRAKKNIIEILKQNIPW